MAFSLVSWNIFNHDPTFAARLLLVSRTLEAADAEIVALQEVPATGGVEYALARDLGYDFVASAPFRRPDDEWTERLVVLSRLPMSEVESLELRPGVTNALRVRLDTPAGRVDLYNLHLHPRDQALRQAELTAVVAGASGRLAVLPVIAGDFNADPTSPVFEAAPGLRSAYEIANGEHPARTYATPLRGDVSRRPAAFDHVLVDPARIRVAAAETIGEAGSDGQWASDHWGLQITFEPLGRAVP
jgi:endonuclease/exonuclease/phosphatase family metal-dependent hydrolase